MAIPTTHAGSLPRPLELTGLYARRAQGGHVDAEALAAAGRKATDAVVARQIEAGVSRSATMASSSGRASSSMSSTA